ncbi:hypothetical protein PAXRUDRAFT_179831, partial [Paxillus rubicundulus Ve08.2h10]
KELKYAPGSTNCCCHRILYNQPDFLHVDSLLEATCKVKGFEVLLLPKFHCELNFIEQSWSYAKRIYSCYPSCRFMDAYHKGLNVKQAALAANKYRGH